MPSSWSNISSLTKLNIFVDSGSKNSSLYANGRHQISVDVIIEPRNKNNKIIQISSAEIFNNINLVDYKNSLIPSSFKKSLNHGEFVYPIINENSSGKYNICSFYLSVDKPLVSPFKVYVRCMVKGKEYTTAKENNNGNSTVDWISLSILPSRIFADSNLDIVKKQEKSVAGYNDQLTKYYVRFKENSEILNHSASIKESFIFHYKQTGNYKGNSTSTDSSVKIDSLKKYTASFSFDNGWKVDVTSKNHEEIGVCLWAYCMWYGALWSYSERSEPLQFYLYDQYGNSANVSVVADGDENLSFSVNLIE